MALDPDVQAYIDRRFELLEDDVARAIGIGHRTHDARPSIDRAGLEVQYGTVTAVSTAEVTVILDADSATPVAMFSMVNVAAGDRIVALFVPPSSGLVLGTLGGLRNAAPLDGSWPSIQVSAATFMPTITEVNHRVEIDVDCTITLPSFASQPISDDSRLSFMPIGGATLTIVADTGVTILSPEGLTSGGDGAEMWCTRLRFDVYGDTWVVQQ